MSGRRDPNEGDEGEAGIRLLNQLVRTRLLVSVRAGQDNVETNLLRYTYVKGPGGANMDSGPRAYEITSGPTQRITLALRNDDLDADAPSLQALVARAELVSPLFVPRLRRFIYAIGGQGVAQMGTWLQFHQAPRAASAAICAGVVVDVFGKVATKEIVAALIACRADQILPAIEDYLYTQKGMARGDID